MSEEERHQVFISYARPDSRWVFVAVSLLRAGGAKVFLDVNDLEYGDRWKEALSRTIAGCQRVLVFWSAAAASSKWVNREWVLALNLQKRVVPVSLDDTPLPPELAQLHGLPQLTTLLALGEQALGAPQSSPAPAASAGPRRLALRSSKWIVVAAGLATAGALTLGVVSWPDLISRLLGVLEVAVTMVLASPGIQIIVIGAIVLVGFTLIAWRRKAKRARLRAMFGQYMSPEVERDMLAGAGAGADQQLGRKLVSALFAEA
jgi:hypothetical protein